MSLSRKHQIRQAILGDLTDVYPSILSIEKLLSSPNVMGISEITHDEMLPELSLLEAGAYLVNVNKGRPTGARYKATFAGMTQINRETALDEAIWGESAL